MKKMFFKLTLKKCMPRLQGLHPGLLSANRESPSPRRYPIRFHGTQFESPSCLPARKGVRRVRVDSGWLKKEKEVFSFT